MLNEKKLKILSYVESRMSFIAPNLSVIVGPTVATKLMGMILIIMYVHVHLCQYKLRANAASKLT